jgi:hypothetical protein
MKFHSDRIMFHQLQRIIICIQIIQIDIDRLLRLSIVKILNKFNHKRNIFQNKDT